MQEPLLVDSFGRGHLGSSLLYNLKESYSVSVLCTLLHDMSFALSVGDFAILGQFAWMLYKSCKDAPESFKNISQEVLSLHLVLKEVEETYSDAVLSATQQSRLANIGNGCRAILKDLEAILHKYNSLGKAKRTWNRLGWGSNDIAELRARLMSNTVLLTTFVK